MEIDPAKVSANDVYKTMIRAIAPRPIAWVSTVSPTGATNLAPFSYFNGVCSDPAVLSFSVVNKPDGTPKDTVRNIRANEQFVVNVVPFFLADSMAQTAADLPYEESEIDAAGLTTIDSVRVSPPRIDGSPIHFECRLFQLIEVGDGPTGANLILGKIELIHIHDGALDESGKVDSDLIDLVGRMGGRDYCRTSDRFSVK
ncbi:flavin reductase family protein [Mariniblastus sp.]|nr:flavin reductase family protein [Mariniblastus sp.]